MISVTFTVNGKTVTVGTSPTRTLLDLLREELGLTGTKEGCGKGECGACTVLLDGKAVTSCLVLAAQLEGREVLTVEGLASDRIGKALQDSCVESGAVQCGYCIPGFLMAARALLQENPHPTLDEIKEGLSGNLCRCTGYAKIFDGVRLAVRRLAK
ncbi:MAG: (2Fe-2S)-binding protein [Candidatus Aureabacteria bacterium]|nr:(2Fe-2S)-binding protein [Candidatus Auribacterota bacterium]